MQYSFIFYCAAILLVVFGGLSLVFPDKPVNAEEVTDTEDKVFSVLMLSIGLGLLFFLWVFDNA